MHIFGKEISLSQIFLLAPFPSNSQQQNHSNLTDIGDNSSHMLEPSMPNHDDSSQAQKEFQIELWKYKPLLTSHDIQNFEEFTTNLGEAIRTPESMTNNQDLFASSLLEEYSPGAQMIIEEEYSARPVEKSLLSLPEDSKKLTIDAELIQPPDPNDHESLRPMPRISQENIISPSLCFNKGHQGNEQIEFYLPIFNFEN